MGRAALAMAAATRARCLSLIAACVAARLCVAGASGEAGSASSSSSSSSPGPPPSPTDAAVGDGDGPVLRTVASLGILAFAFAVLYGCWMRRRGDSDEMERRRAERERHLDGALGDTGENFAVGGENRWAYSSFVNWEFFPTQSFPILVYFKETATPQDKWAVGPGQFANSDDALAKGAVQGQVHFFPCIGNADQLRDEFIKNGCAKL